MDARAGQIETSGNVNEAEEASTVVKEIAETCSEEKQAVKAAESESVVNLENKIDESAEKSEIDFSCLICDFRSNWENGLQIHMARKHCNIEQFDGNVSVASDEVDDDKKYSETYYYWKTGKLGTIFQSFIDANDIIGKINLEEEDKSKEKEKVLQARKLAFGNNFRKFPPWK